MRGDAQVSPVILGSGMPITCSHCGALNRVKKRQRSAVCDRCKQIFIFYSLEHDDFLGSLGAGISEDRVDHLRHKWIESDQMKDNPNRQDFIDLWTIIEKLQNAFEAQRDAADELRNRVGSEKGKKK